MIILEIIWGIVKPLLTTKGASYVVLAVIIVAATFYGGMHYEGLREDSRQKAAIKDALDEFKEQAEKGGLFTKEIEIIKTIIVEKEIEVIKDAVKTDLCVNNQPTDDFRRLFNKSIGLTNAEKTPP